MFFFRSETSGNCLFSSASMSVVGDNSLVDILRVMSCIELFLQNNIQMFSALETLLKLSISDNALILGYLVNI